MSPVISLFRYFGSLFRCLVISGVSFGVFWSFGSSRRLQGLAVGGGGCWVSGSEAIMARISIIENKNILI